MRDLSRTVGYCRVSTQRQQLEGHGLERYLDQLQRYGLTDSQIFFDIESGNSESRAGYNKVLSLVRSGEIDRIVVPALDRFTRSAIGWENALIELRKYEVTIDFLDGSSIDVTSPEGMLYSRMLAAVAANYRDKKIHDATAGANFFREKRKIYKAVFGYVKDGDTVKLNTAEYRNSGKTYAELAREIIEMFLKTGEVAGTIRYFVNIYGAERISNQTYDDFPRDISSCKRWMINPQLVGKICYYPHDKKRRIIVQGSHEALISEDEHNELLRLFSLRPSVRHAPPNPLSGLVYCGACGQKMEMHSTIQNNIRYERFRCTGHYPKPRKLKNCNVKTYFKVDLAIKTCIESLQSRSQEIGENYFDSNTKTLPEILNLKQQIIELKSRNDPDLTSAILSKELRLEHLIQNNEANNNSDITRNQLLKIIAADSRYWDKANNEQLTVVFQELIDKVTCLLVDGSQFFAASLKI